MTEQNNIMMSPSQARPRHSNFSELADHWSEQNYANLNEHMRRRAFLIVNLGPKLHPADSILELGCGDGYLGCLLVSQGFRYTGVDIAPGMIAAAKKRAADRGLRVDFRVADIYDLAPSDAYDAIFSTMNTFFRYVNVPVDLLRHWRPYLRQKMIIDWSHHNDLPLIEACQIMQRAGYANVNWHPCFSPTQKQLPGWALHLLYALEYAPIIRTLVLRRKFFALLWGIP
jgi:ubiquinone/menaquinone biosynthesis C-methylase UbiE